MSACSPPRRDACGDTDAEATWTELDIAEDFGAAFWLPALADTGAELETEVLEMIELTDLEACAGVFEAAAELLLVDLEACAGAFEAGAELLLTDLELVTSAFALDDLGALLRYAVEKVMGPLESEVCMEYDLSSSLLRPHTSLGMLFVEVSSRVGVEVTETEVVMVGSSSETIGS